MFYSERVNIFTIERVHPTEAFLLTTPEDVDFIVGGFYGEDIAVHFHVACHGFIVDI